MTGETTARKLTLKLQNGILDLSEPRVMGILNVTPDSFYAESRTNEEICIAERAIRIAEEGGTIIDVGGYSSRPGAEWVSTDDEIARLMKALTIVRRETPLMLISVDTFRADVAKVCIDHFGVELINDITGGDGDPRMFDLIAETHVAYILMHMRGTPETMQSLTTYTDVTTDVITDLRTKIERLRSKGVHEIVVDPGFGFSKTMEQNYELLARLSDFSRLNLPILIGISRKSMIYRALDIQPSEALNGTTVLNTIALLNGAHILRVHDVKEAVEAVRLTAKVR